MNQDNARTGADVPVVLKAIELILAKPADIKREATALREKFKQKHPTKTAVEVRRLAGKKVIDNYSYFTAFAGGATALTGVIPGLGTAIAAFGGAAADAAVTMKYQIEMTMALATIYDHDIEVPEQKRICMIVAGLGTINEAGKTGGSRTASRAFVKLVREHLKGSTLEAVKAVFKMVGLTFTRKSLEKAIPFGVGVVIGFSANKVLTWYVGKKAIDFFEADEHLQAEPAYS